MTLENIIKLFNEIYSNRHFSVNNLYLIRFLLEVLVGVGVETALTRHGCYNAIIGYRND